MDDNVFAYRGSILLDFINRFVCDTSINGYEIPVNVVQRFIRFACIIHYFTTILFPRNQEFTIKHTTECYIININRNL